MQAAFLFCAKLSFYVNIKLCSGAASGDKSKPRLVRVGALRCLFPGCNGLFLVAFLEPVDDVFGRQHYDKTADCGVFRHYVEPVKGVTYCPVDGHQQDGCNNKCLCFFLHGL